MGLLGCLCCPVRHRAFAPEGGLLDGEEAPEAPDNEEQEERDFYSRMESIVRRRPGGKRKRSDVEVCLPSPPTFALQSR